MDGRDQLVRVTRHHGEAARAILQRLPEPGHREQRLVGAPLVAQADKAADPAISLCVAREFWRLGNVNALVDRGDYRAARKATNGGSIGLVDVANRRARLLGILA